MARLSAQEALKTLEEPKNKNLIAKAVRHEERLRLHSQSVKSVDGFKREHQEFKGWIKNIIHPDKFTAFEKIFRPPFATNSLLKTVFSEYSRVFKGDNFFVKFHFNNSDLRADAEQARTELQDKTFFETEGFEALKKRISSILIVDLPEVQRESRPMPYFYLLDIGKVISIDAKKSRITGPDKRQYHRIEHIAFEEEKDKKAAVFCDEYYRTYEKNNHGQWINKTEVQHSLFSPNGDVLDGPGRCPAQFFWNATEDEEDFIVKDSPITASLSDLDWLLAWSYFEKMYDLYGPFPVLVGATEKCDYMNEQNQPCTGGFTLYNEEYKDAEGNVYDIRATQKECPSCSKSKFVGPGTFIQKPAADGITDKEMQKPFEIISPPVDNLTYVGTKTKTLKDEIFLNCVGKASEIMNNQAQNEKQIQGQFESKENVLWEIKKQFELIHEFALEMWAKLRYGNKFEKVDVNYGDKFYLQDEFTLLEEIIQSDRAKLPEWETRNQFREYILTKYRNNPDELQRALILVQLEPFQGKSLEEVVTMRKEGLPVTNTDIILKSRFSELIDRFEREYLPIHLFAEGEDLKNAIDKIKNQLTTYVNELNSQAAADPGPLREDGGTERSPDQRGNKVPASI